MPSNQTQNYQLNQWVKSDQVQMEDFNADNAKIDAALKAEADARTAAITNLAQTRNCRAYVTTYTGTGTSGPDHPSTLTFPGKPLFVSIMGYDYYDIFAAQGQQSTLSGYSNPRSISFIWTGNTITWYEVGSSSDHQCNEKGRVYHVFAILQA